MVQSTAFIAWTHHAELVSRLEHRLTTPDSAVTFETVAKETSGAEPRDIALETIVREGRPALLIKENRIARDGVIIEAAREITNRILQAAPTVEPAIPLVGRIDVANYPGSATYLGTGWLVDRNIVVTNRHVAELIARKNDGKYRFRTGRFGEDLIVTLDYRHEFGVDAMTVAPVVRVVWIEPDPRKADIAFLEIGGRTDGTTQEFIALADEDAKPDTDVVVIGYPARAPAHIIPDQAWMEKIYGGTYDVKRIAPGLMGGLSRGWATHDCTTLGGNSGSVVIDMKGGKAVALHFSGLYMIENYAVPASTVRKYLKDRPWHNALGPPGPSTRPSRSELRQPTLPERPPSPPADVSADQSQVSVTIPLTITISLGAPQVTSASVPASSSALPSANRPPATGHVPILDAARHLFGQLRVEGVLAVWPGYLVQGSRLTDTDCLVVSAHPARLEVVRAAAPPTYAQFPVDVRPASLEEQLGTSALAVAEEAVTSVMYNDEDRTGEGFSFDGVDEEMTAVIHVGPEQSWAVLSDFLSRTQQELVSSIYEFHAAHVADAIERKLDAGASMTLVLAMQSRDPKQGPIRQGDFDRSETFARWESTYGDRFDRIFVPRGSQGLVAQAYHIKVTVRDRKAVWLSSGNWKRSSQPLIPPEGLNDARVAGRAGNREWHVVIENETLARRFRNHIKADFEQSLELGGTPETVEDQVLVDVPRSVLEAVELEAPPARVLAPLIIRRRMRVKPLLTPDRRGWVYSQAVLQLIRSATQQLLFQNQYINMKGADGGYLKQLVEALIQKSQEVEDFRIILRTENDQFWYDVSQLKRRGLDVHRCVRRLAHTHTKGIIVDGSRALVGSHNWSAAGVTLNRDASLIFDDGEVTQYYLEAFDLDWDRAAALAFEELSALEAPRLAASDEPPPGFVRMPLSDYLEG
jgi:V8-like Glu-specific endopeptidase